MPFSYFIVTKLIETLIPCPIPTWLIPPTSLEVLLSLCSPSTFSLFVTRFYSRIIPHDVSCVIRMGKSIFVKVWKDLKPPERRNDYSPARERWESRWKSKKPVSGRHNLSPAHGLYLSAYLDPALTHGARIISPLTRLLIYYTGSLIGR